MYDYARNQIKENSIAMKSLQMRETSESLRFLDSIIGHKEIEKSYIKDLVNRIRTNKKMIWSNKYLTLDGKIRCFFVAFFPSFYMSLVSFLKLLLGRTHA